MKAQLIPALDQQIASHQQNRFSPRDVASLSEAFHRDGIIIVPDVVPAAVRQQAREECLRLLGSHAERRDLTLATTDNTARKMSVVQSENIAAHGHFIKEIYRSPALIRFLETIARDAMFPCPSKDEEFLITRHERPGDLHGWHWGDFSFALIWIIECPPIELGGLLQCVPHTQWDKSNPRIFEYLRDNPIRTYAFQTGDIYFLRTDTTLHGTIPLTEPSTRIILNMTWASRKDLQRSLAGNDRWWSEAEAPAARSL